MLKNSFTALVCLIVFNIFTTPVEAGNRETWIGSQRGLVNLQGFQTPNIALGVPGPQVEDQLLKILKFKSSNLSLNPEVVRLEKQHITALAGFELVVPISTSGLNIEITIKGNSHFAIALNFDGSSISFFPGVDKISVQEIDAGGVTIPTDIEGKIPIWLQDAIIKYLNDRNLLQLPAEISTSFSYHANGKYGNQDLGAVSLSSNAAVGEFWIVGSSVLIEKEKEFVTAIAEANYSLSFHDCDIDNSPNISGVFTKFDSNEVIHSIGHEESAILFQGSSDRIDINFRAYWRYNNITLNQIDVSPNPADNTFQLAFTSLPKGHGTYRLMITADLIDPNGKKQVCNIYNANIIKFPALASHIHNPITEDLADEAFQEFRKKFYQKRLGGGLPIHDRLFAAIRKRTVVGIIGDVVSGIGINGSVDAGKLPGEKLSARVELPDDVTDKIDCNPDKECKSERNCTVSPCPFHEDTRNCRRKIPPFGPTINEPTCESLKAASNAFRRLKQQECNAREALKKLDCERLKSQEILLCEIEKSAQKSSCEAIKQTIKDILLIAAPDDQLADVEGEFSFGGGINFQLLRMRFIEAANEFEIDLSYDANLGVNATIGFTPKNIGGHVVGCMAKWKESVTLHANIPPSETMVSGKWDVDVARKSIVIEASLPGKDVRTTSAPFVKMFQMHPHLIALCPVLFNVGVGEGIYDLIDPKYKSSLWTGEFKVEDIAVTYDFDVPGIEIPRQFGLPQPNLNLFDEGTVLTWR